MNLNIDPDWLIRMAEKEGDGIFSVGGLMTKAFCEAADMEAATPITCGLNNDDVFTQLLNALGWQGGTVHQAMAEVRRLAKAGCQVSDPNPTGFIPKWMQNEDFVDDLPDFQVGPSESDDGVIEAFPDIELSDDRMREISERLDAAFGPSDLTDADIETMLAVARDKNALSGQYKRQPRKVPTVDSDPLAIRPRLVPESKGEQVESAGEITVHGKTLFRIISEVTTMEYHGYELCDGVSYYNDSDGWHAKMRLAKAGAK